MLENSSTFQRFKQAGDSSRSLNIGGLPYMEPEPEDKTPRRIALTVALVFHVVLFLVSWPESRADPRWAGSPRKAYVIQQVRFKPPPPKRQQQIPKKQERKRVIPVPDPTPDELEPIVVDEIVVAEFDLTEGDEFGIPDAPPSAGPGVPGAMRMTGDILPPRKIHYPQPRYTEEGRQARIQGVVILEAIIDAMGKVSEVKVLKGLPMGLGESAVETALAWRFEPATLDGEPVPVFFNLTIRFSLQ